MIIIHALLDHLVITITLLAFIISSFPYYSRSPDIRNSEPPYHDLNPLLKPTF